MGGQRLLALLAIKDGTANRASAAGTLWPEATSARAVANLRSVLWRLGKACQGVIDASLYDLRLAPHVAVDIGQALSIARELLDRSAVLSLGRIREGLNCNLYEDILPDLGDEEWLEAERERFRQLRVHSLETLSDHLIAVGWHGAAIEAALGAIRSDPFRESAYHVLIKAYLAEGSYLEARHQHLAYRRLLQRELGLEPSDRFMCLLDNAGIRGPHAGELPAAGQDHAQGGVAPAPYRTGGDARSQRPLPSGPRTWQGSSAR
ncbi:MAG: transcriptional regulator [Micromonosporaceae bacterium]|nr:transcriptional regulator [Micromonosporaceae bacterium]